MKYLLILTIASFSSIVAAQDLKLNADVQELVIKFDKKPAQSKSAKILNAILNNSELIQLKDGTIISIKDLTDKGQQESNGRIEDFERALKISGGSGTGGGG